MIQDIQAPFFPLHFGDEKKVRFATTPDMCKSVPWASDSDSQIKNISNTNNNFDLKLDIDLKSKGASHRTGDLEVLMPDKNMFGIESNVTNEFTQLRTPYNRDQPSNYLAVILVILLLFILFSIIWWIANKLLLIEVEEQVTNTVAQHLKFHRN